MDTQLLQELDTVQKYLSTLFDSLPQIDINQYLPLQATSSSIQNQIIKQNIEYGRKIIQLSDKFTAKYRKDHFVDRKDIEEKILQIFKYICPKTYCNSLDDMVTSVIKKLQEGLIDFNGANSGSSIGQPLLLNNNSRTNSIHNFQYGTKDSKIQFYRDEADINYMRYQSSQPLRGNVNPRQIMSKSKVTIQNMPLQTVESEQIRRKRSNNKSKVSKNGTTKKQKNQQQDINKFTTKNVLQIKTYFQQQEIIIRKLFQKLNKIISSPNHGQRVSPKISQQNRQYTKIVNDSQKDNIKDFVHANIENNKVNLNKLNDFIQLLQEYFQKKNKIQGLAQGKFTIYIEEINKRQELFSFTVSKLLENLANLRQVIEKNDQNGQNKQGDQQQGQELNNPISIVQSLQQISHSFYSIYPSHSVLKDLKIQSTTQKTHSHLVESVSFPLNQKQLQKIGYKSQGVQVCLGMYKNQKSVHREMAQSKRNLLQLFKTNTRMSQLIQKFQRSIKYKKNVELKQIQKFIESIRDVFSKRINGQYGVNIPDSIAKQAISYQEQLRRIIQINEKNQKQLNQQCIKKCKKYEKQIQQLQKSIQQLIIQNKKQQEKLQSNIRKQTKKIEVEKQQNKKVLNVKNSLQKNIKQMRIQIDRLQRDIRQQYCNFQESQKILVGQNVGLRQNIRQLQQQKTQLKKKIQEQNQKFQEERQIYHKKIIFLQSQEEQKNQQTSHMEYQLEQMIKNNKVLKKQIQQLTQVYEQKIRQLEELIQNIKQLQDELRNKNLQNIQFKEKNRINEEVMGNLERQKNRLVKQLSAMEDKYRQKESQAQKYKQLGVLNESDINILKQQMDKVKQAYMQSQDQLEQLKIYVSQIESQKDFILRQNRNYRKQIESCSERIQNEQIIRDRLQKQVRSNLDEVLIKKKQLSHYLIQSQQGKKQITKLRKQLNQARQMATKYQSQFRTARQQLQKKTQSESIQSGRRKLQLQAAKVELRRKTQQIQKMKENYDEKLEMLQSKNKQLTQFITQKQLLAKITTSHLSQ